MKRIEWVIAAAVAGNVAAGIATALTHSAASPSGRPVGVMGETPPTDSEARAVLDRLVAAAATRDRNTYCALTEPREMCESQWEFAGGDDAVPLRPPHLLGMQVVDNARVLHLCGIDGSGSPYRSEIPVIYFDAEAKASLGPFWRSFTYSGRVSGGPRIVTPFADASQAPLPPVCG